MIIGISGLAGSGKDTAAAFLGKNHNFVRVGLADPLKRICRDAFNFTDEQLWGPSEKRNAPDKRYPRDHHEFYGPRTCKVCGVKIDGSPDEEPCYLTPRYALQTLGTEWGRVCYGDVWIEHGIRTAEKLMLDSGAAYTPALGIYRWSSRYSPLDQDFSDLGGVVFSDIRFKNEMAAIKAAGGKLWRMKRGDGLGGAAGLHASEREQRKVPDEDFDVVIENTDISLEQLEKQVSLTLL